MLNCPEVVPATVGEKIPLIVQVAEGATVVQLFVCEKAPVGVTAETVKLPVPQFVTVMARLGELVFTGWLPKSMVVGLKHTAGVTTIPVPVSVATVGLVGAFEAMDNDALRAPVLVGLNTIENVQENPAANDVLQVFVCEKSAAFAPVKEIAPKFSGPVPLLVKTIVCPADELPTD